MENKFTHSKKLQVTSLYPRVYNIRHCPFCETLMYGMPGGRDAHCVCCGYKDPCCGD